MPCKMLHRTVLLVLERDDKYLLVRRNQTNYHGLWEFPGGHVDEGETPYEAALREASEEVGRVDFETRPTAVFTHSVMPGERGGIVGRHMHRCHVFRGRLLGEVRLSTEASEYGWFSPPAAARLELTPYTKTALKRLGIADWCEGSGRLL